MRAMAAGWQKFRAHCATLIAVLALTSAPTALAVKHGPGALAAEADQRATHAKHGHVHEQPMSDHHDSTDHEHVGAAVLGPMGTEFHPAPDRTLRPVSRTPDGTIRDGPRRPPRLTVL